MQKRALISILQRRKSSENTRVVNGSLRGRSRVILYQFANHVSKQINYLRGASIHNKLEGLYQGHIVSEFKVSIAAEPLMHSSGCIFAIVSPVLISLRHELE